MPDERQGMPEPGTDEEYQRFLARNTRRDDADEVDFADEHTQAGFTGPVDEDAHPNSVRREPEVDLPDGDQRAGSVRGSTLSGDGEN